jgi:ABC-type dipeptide/oligopeptide/nickel transport system permease subunit
MRREQKRIGGGVTQPTHWSTARAFISGAARFYRTSRVGSACLVFLLLLAVVGILADRLAPFDPLEANYALVRSAPSAVHLLGTDELGRDVLSRLIYGARITLLVAIISVATGDTLGFLWGLLSGYFGGKTDLMSQRALEVLLSFPSFILALLLMVGLGAGLHTVIMAVAITQVPLATRVTRSIVLSVKEATYVEAARAVGASHARILALYIAPQCLAPFLIVASAHLGVAIFTESALSFLGVGVPPPTPTWGNMLGGVLAQTFRPPWWMVVFPGVAVTLTILAANLPGDAIRDFIDPKLTRSLDRG